MVYAGILWRELLVKYVLPKLCNRTRSMSNLSQGSVSITAASNINSLLIVLGATSCAKQHSHPVHLGALILPREKSCESKINGCN
jgi:hypothetical protein